MANDTNKLIADTLLMFGNVKTNVEGACALLEQARATMQSLGGCDDELTHLARAKQEVRMIIARIEPKIRYVSNLTPSSRPTLASASTLTPIRRKKRH